MTYCVIIHQSVNITGTHTDMYMLCDMIKYTGVNSSTLFDTKNILCTFDQTAIWHNLAISSKLANFFIKLFMTLFIFFATATPAAGISMHFHIFTPLYVV